MNLPIPGGCLPNGGIGRSMKAKQMKALEGKFSDGSKSAGMTVSTMAEWYDAKHRSASPEG